LGRNGRRNGDRPKFKNKFSKGVRLNKRCQAELPPRNSQHGFIGKKELKNLVPGRKSGNLGHKLKLVSGKKRKRERASK